MLLRKIVNIIIKYYCINKKQVIVFELGCLLRLKMALNVYSLRLKSTGIWHLCNPHYVHRFWEGTLSAFLSFSNACFHHCGKLKQGQAINSSLCFFHESYQARQVKPLCWMGEDFWTCKTGDTPAPGGKTMCARPDRVSTNHISVLRISLRSHYTIPIVQRSITCSN